jgi:hypothetical protein
MLGFLRTVDWVRPPFQLSRVLRHFWALARGHRRERTYRKQACDGDAPDDACHNIATDNEASLGPVDE